jgi:hypothetical protein
MIKARKMMKTYERRKRETKRNRWEEEEHRRKAREKD